MNIRVLLLTAMALVGASLAPTDASAQRYNDDGGKSGWWWGRKGQSGLWEKLGTQRVAFTVDRDTINVGRREGRFEAVKFRVLGSDVEILSAQIVFGNGESENLGLRGTYRPGEETAVIRLAGRGGERYIERVNLTYRSRPSFRGEAHVELWGMHDDDRGGRAESVRRDDDRRGAVIVTPGRGGPQWEMLGERRVDIRTERDVVPVGRWEGSFTRIRLRAVNSDIDLRDVTIVYSDGSVDNWPVRRRVRDEEEGPTFDLRGRSRTVREVIMTYRASNPNGRPTVQVWGGH